jgi:hypothetical protein
MDGVKLCGHSPYGYVAYINNQRIEFATESELYEWIGDNDYGFKYNIQVCILGDNRRTQNANKVI